MPVLPLGAALALAAVVAPPDAVAAVSIGRRLGLPPRVMTVLTGESLFNDATALTPPSARPWYPCATPAESTTTSHPHPARARPRRG
ncbi:MAG: hypothetical protein WAL99_23930 [Pseudonocardiaceae bacterium]